MTEFDRLEFHMQFTIGIAFGKMYKNQHNDLNEWLRVCVGGWRCNVHAPNSIDQTHLNNLCGSTFSPVRVKPFSNATTMFVYLSVTGWPIDPNGSHRWQQTKIFKWYSPSSTAATRIKAICFIFVGDLFPNRHTKYKNRFYILLFLLCSGCFLQSLQPEMSICPRSACATQIASTPIRLSCTTADIVKLYNFMFISCVPSFWQWMAWTRHSGWCHFEWDKGWQSSPIRTESFDFFSCT